MKEKLDKILENNSLIAFEAIIQESDIIKAVELFKASKLATKELHALILFINTLIEVKKAVTTSKNEQNDLIILDNFNKLVNERLNVENSSYTDEDIAEIILSLSTSNQNHVLNASFRQVGINPSLNVQQDIPLKNESIASNFKPDLSPCYAISSKQVYITQLIKLKK